MNNIKRMSELKPHETADVVELRLTGAMRRRLQDIGLINGTQIECVGRSPLGDPCAYFIRGAVIALRKEEACEVMVQTRSEAYN